MTIAEAINDFKIKWDKIDSSVNKNFLDQEIDWLLNDAQLAFIRSRYNYNNIAKSDYESNQSRTDELSTISIQFPVQPAIDLVPVDYGSYKLSKIDLSTLAFPYMHLTSIEVYNVYCKRWVNPILESHDNYLEELNNPFNKESCIYNFNSENGVPFIYIYGDVNKARISYLRFPDRIFSGTYQHPFVNGSTPVGFSLPNQTHPIIVDMAVDLAKGISTVTYDFNKLQNALS